MDVNVHTVVKAILAGGLDGSFNAIRGAIDSRKKTIASAARATMKVGDPIRLVNCRPKYLNGEEGKIVKINPKRIVVDLNTPCGNGKWFKDIHCPADMIELIEAE